MKKLILFLSLAIIFLILISGTSFAQPQESSLKEMVAQCQLQETGEEKLSCMMDLVDEGVLGESVCNQMAETGRMGKQRCYDLLARLRIQICAEGKEERFEAYYECSSKEISKGYVSELFCDGFRAPVQVLPCQKAFEDNYVFYFLNRNWVFEVGIIVFILVLIIGFFYLKKYKPKSFENNKGQTSLEYILLVGMAMAAAVIVVFLLISIASSSADLTDDQLDFFEDLLDGDSEECTDTDGGKDYYVKGSVSGYFSPSAGGGYIERTDSCADSPQGVLSEWYCTSDGFVELDNYRCPNSCQEGACIGDLQLERIEELGQGARPEIFYNNGMFFLVYLLTDKGGIHNGRVYDSDFNPLSEEILISTQDILVYGGARDVRGIQDSGKAYLSYNTSKPSGDGHLFVTVRNLDATFSVDTGATHIVESLSGDEEALNDPAVYLRDGSLYILTDIPKGPGGPTIFVLRKLDPSNLQEVPGEQLNLDAELDGLPDVATLFEKDGINHGIFSHLVKLGITHTFRMISFDDGFTDPTVVKDLVDEGVNLHPTGLLHWDGRYFLAHSRNDLIVDCSGAAEDDRETWLRMFDENFELLDAIKLEEHGLHPTLTTDGEKLYLAYSACGTLKVAVFQVN